MRTIWAVLATLLAAVLAVAPPAGRVAAQAPPAATFAAFVSYGTGVNPRLVAIGDLNGDGRLDLAVANGASNTVSVLLGNGDGTFASIVNYATGNFPRSVAIGDLNGDGKPDLATPNFNRSTVSVLLGSATTPGTFAAKVDYATGTSPTSVAIGDLNGDDKPDLAVANFGGNTASVLLGNGDGTFGTKTDYPAGNGPLSVAIGDLNGDGRPDLAVANATSNTASVLLGSATTPGTFAAKVDYATGNFPLSVAIGDLNGDGKPDLATANSSGNTASVLLGNGDGTFGARVDYATGSGPLSVAIGDLNGDGKPDLAVANLFGNTASVLLGNGDGTFAAKTDYPAGNGPSSLAIGDLNGDGRPDLAVTTQSSNSVSVLLNTTTGPFTYVVTRTADDVNDTNCTARCTLRQAVNAANANDPGAGGNTIIFDITFNTPKTITLTPAYGQLALSKNVTVTGPGANVLTVRRDAAAAEFRIFSVGSGVTATISGLTITGGRADRGGGIANSGIATLTGSTLSGNTSSLGIGGGIYNTGSLRITGSTLSGNTAMLSGGAVYNDNGGTLVVTNSTFSGNTAGGGSAIFSSGTLTVTNGTLSGNTAGAANLGAIYNGNTVTLTSSVVAGNNGIGVFTSTGSTFTDGGGNVTGGDPLLAPLGDYGGPTQTRPPLPGSPAIDAGGAGCSMSDQRGLSRPVGGACDSGAIESRGFTLAKTGGDNQTTVVGTAFAQPLAVSVAGNVVSGMIREPVTGGQVTFTPPGMGASTTPMTSPATINAMGAASVSATANATAGGPYVVTAGAAGAASVAFALTNIPTVALAPATLPNGTAGVAYSQGITATGGTGSGYTFAVSAGNLPTALTLAANGTLSGTPTTAGMFTFTVQATDGGMNSGTRQYTVTIGPATVTSVAITRTSGGTVTGGVTSVPAGGAVQLALTATYSDGSMQAITGGAMWTSSDPAKATVDGTGRVTSLSPGTVTITATYMGQTTTFTLVVVAPGTGGLMPNPAPVARPDAATPPVAPVAPMPPTRAAPGGGIGAQGGEATPTPRPAPPMR